MQFKSLLIASGVLTTGIILVTGFSRYSQMRDASIIRETCEKNAPFQDKEELCPFLVKEFFIGRLRKDHAIKISEDIAAIFDYPDVESRYLKYLIPKGFNP